MNGVELALAEVDRAVACRLAALEAADSPQERPKKTPCIWDRVCFMEWETWEDLGLDPPAGEERKARRRERHE